MGKAFPGESLIPERPGGVRAFAVVRVPRSRAPVGVARVPVVWESTRRLPPPPPPAAPVFVDDTGRRGRWVAVAGAGTALLVLALVAVFWLSQAVHL